jgi:hypothetical protein
MYKYWPTRLSQSAVSFIGSLGYPLLSQGVGGNRLVLKGAGETTRVNRDSSKFLKTIPKYLNDLNGNFVIEILTL